MSTVLIDDPTIAPAQAPLPWQVHRYDDVGSTNDLAARLDAWHVVVARRQSHGRGRHGRAWVSGEGGVWVSAVLPTPGPAEPWSVLPLVAGWALREMLRTFGLTSARLRWPNDVMVGRAKLAGILVERFRADTAVVGFGLNYLNDPAAHDPALAGHAVRLADLVDPLPDREEVLMAALAYLQFAQRRIALGETASLLPTLNQAWSSDRVLVTLRPIHSQIAGAFRGVTAEGHLRVCDDAGEEYVLPPAQVELLREVA